jgi:type I restriction enzyme S subunit
MSKAIPKLRFKEFEGKWVNKKLETIVEKVNSGKTPLGGESVYVPNGVLFIRSQNVLDNKLSLENSTYITEEVNSTMKNSIVRPKDILLNITGASLGRSCVVPDDFTIGNVNQHVCIIRLSKENDPYFLQPIFASEKGQNLFTSLQTGSGREGLNFQSIKNASLSFPTLPEQQKIASFLSAVDEKIQQLTRKKELLEQYKKGVMQQLFCLRYDSSDSGDGHDGTSNQGNQKNHSKSQFRQLRFKDENGKAYPKWEEKRLGEISNKKSSNIAANNIEANHGTYKIYGASGFLKYVDFYNEEEPFISIVKDGAGVGRTLLCDAKSSVLGTLDIIKPTGKIDLYFLYSVLNIIDFTKYSIGSTIPHIYFKDYSKEKIRIPSFDEQQKIANFLSAIDTKIESVATQIEKTQTFKKGLLQQMFV